VFASEKKYEAQKTLVDAKCVVVRKKVKEKRNE
jgi:hypothetical protein